MKHQIRQSIDRNQIAEDPSRRPPEKETALNLHGDATHFTVTSFKQVVFGKLLDHSEFEVKHLNVLNGEEQEETADSLGEVATNPELTIIGATGQLPVASVFG